MSVNDEDMRRAYEEEFLPLLRKDREEKLAQETRERDYLKSMKKV